MTGRLAGRVAIVTGAGQGLGAALAMRLAAEGCSGVVVADIKAEAAAAHASAIAASTAARAVPSHTDVTDEVSADAMAALAVAEFGRIDILVSNAGILRAWDITEFPVDDWRAVIDVNLTGYFLCARAVARVMIAQKSGVIVQINSKSGKKGSFRNSAYAASKFGGIGLTQSLALDLAPHGIRVNAVCPGNLLDGTLWQESLFDQYARTQGLTVEEVRKKYEAQVPLGRACSYDDVCNAVLYLAGDDSAYVTGEALNVSGGQEMR